MSSGQPLAGRTVLVTGASSGIGAHLARASAAAGARVVLAARRLDRLETLAEEIAGTGGATLPVAMDVTDEVSVIAAFEQAQRRFGTIHGVIANAGISASGMAIDQPVAAWDAAYAVNLRGVFLTVREGARRMIAAGSREEGFGRIVILSSVAASMVQPGLAAYSATKAGVLQMGRVLAREWVRSGVNVNIVCPGYVLTDINADWFATEGGRKQMGGFPRRRLMEPGDLEGTVLHLLGDASRAITGAAFVLDDGQSL